MLCPSVITPNFVYMSRLWQYCSLEISSYLTSPSTHTMFPHLRLSVHAKDCLSGRSFSYYSLPVGVGPFNFSACRPLFHVHIKPSWVHGLLKCRAFPEFLQTIHHIILRGYPTYFQYYASVIRLPRRLHVDNRLLFIGK